MDMDDIQFATVMKKIREVCGRYKTVRVIVGNKNYFVKSLTYTHNKYTTFCFKMGYHLGYMEDPIRLDVYYYSQKDCQRIINELNEFCGSINKYNKDKIEQRG